MFTEKVNCKINSFVRQSCELVKPQERFCSLHFYFYDLGMYILHRHRSFYTLKPRN